MNSLPIQERTYTAADQPPQTPPTPPKNTPLGLSAVEAKPVWLDFDGGQLSSDAGLLLLKEVDQQIGLIQALAAVLPDPRDARYVQHTTEALLRQRIFQIAAGYEDANDSDSLRHDPIVKMVRAPAADRRASGFAADHLAFREPTFARGPLPHGRGLPGAVHPILG